MMESYQSLHPETQFKLLKQVLLRENYLKRLQKKIQEKLGQVDLEIIGLFDILREASSAVVHTIVEWEISQIDYPTEIRPFLWNGQNYLIKMQDDMNFLNKYQAVLNWLGFSIRCNPFIVPLEIFSTQFNLSKQSMIIFGNPPEQKLHRVKLNTEKYIKSPYKTPIINDPNIFKELSVKSQLQKKFKVKPIEANSNNKNNAKNFFQCYLSYEQTQSLREAWEKLQSLSENKESFAMNYPELNFTYNFSNIGTDDMSKTKDSISYHDNIRDLSTQLLSTSKVLSPSELLFDELKNTASRHTLKMDENTNILHRTSDLLSTSSKGVHIWTQHEIHLQREVQRRGGELFILTAASTQGRSKLPWRKTRFQRWESDLNHMKQHEEILNFALEDLLSSASMQPVINADATTDYEMKVEVNTLRPVFGMDGTGNDEYVMDDTNIDKYLDDYLMEPQLVDEKVPKVEGPPQESAEQLILKERIKFLQESIDDIKLRIKFLQYQFKQFSNTADGSITNFNKLGRLRKMKDGQALEEDEKAAISFEDRMAIVIQRKLRVLFGKAFRAMIKKRIHRGMTVFQGLWRKYLVNKHSHVRAAKLRLSLLLQRLFRAKRVKDTLNQLRQEDDARESALRIQRVYRGYRGRYRLKQKRKFIKSMKLAYESVSLEKLSPSEIDELANAIDSYCRDYNYVLPLSVLTVLRAVLYICNGDDHESILITGQDGFTEQKYIRAATCTWTSCKLLLQRKGRFLRRLRAFIQFSSVPNPSQINLHVQCQLHLKALLSSVNVDEFESLPTGKTAVIQLCHFCQHIIAAFELQVYFADYFDPGLPQCYRKLLRLRESFDRSDLQCKTESKCKVSLDHKKKQYAVEGKSWKHIALAVKKTEVNVQNSRDKRAKEKVKYRTFLHELELSEIRKIDILENMERSRTLAYEVAEGDLREYRRNNFIPIEERLKSLQQDVDVKALSLLQCRGELSALRESNQKHKIMRNFDAVLRLKNIYAQSYRLGALLAELLLLGNTWQALLKIIGGSQFIKDLKGEKKEQYLELRERAIGLMNQRKQMMDNIDKDLLDQYHKIKENAFYSNALTRAENWDQPSQVEREAEEFENIECCRRDADFETRQKRQTEYFHIPSSPFKPALVLIDNRIPKKMKNSCSEYFQKYDFQIYDGMQLNPFLLQQMQTDFDNKRHILWFIDRGIHCTARRHFESNFNSLLIALIPTPMVSLLDATLSYQVQEWYHSQSGCYSVMKEINYCHSFDASLYLGRIKRHVGLLQRLLLGDIEELYENKAITAATPNWLRQNCCDDFQSFIKNISFDFGKIKNLDDVALSVYSDFVLSNAIGCVLNLFTPPLSESNDVDVIEGCKVFRKHCNGWSYGKMCKVLYIRNGLKSDLVTIQRVERCLSITKAWKYLEKYSLYNNPARYLLCRWVHDALNLMRSVSSYGGMVDLNVENTPLIKSMKNIRWGLDVCSHYPGEEAVGELLHDSFANCLLYEDTQCPVRYYYDRGCLDSLEQPSMGIVYMIQHVRIYQMEDNIFVGVNVINHLDVLNQITLKNWTFFGRMKVKDFILMLQPNSTEIFEGKVIKHKLQNSENSNENDFTTSWCKLLSRWACLDNIGAKFQISLIRARHLILTKLGTINGYLVRQEIFEERFAEVRILIYGIILNGAVNYLISRDKIYDLMKVCDHYHEKDKLEALDTPSIAYIFSDRLSVSPSKAWQFFLESGELLPRILKRELVVKLRKKRGPGRFVGRKLITIKGNVNVPYPENPSTNNSTATITTAVHINILISIYELENETNAHELRILLFDFKNCQSAEYRISAMERLLLFKDDELLFEQIEKRLRVVYCDRLQSKRTFIGLKEETFQPMIPEFEIEGDNEYDICIDHEDDLTERSRADSQLHYQVDDKLLDKKSLHTTDDDNSTKDSGSVLDHAHDRSQGLKAISEGDNLLEDENRGNPQHSRGHHSWSWVLYFDRTVLDEYIGNLIISFCLSVTLGGFIITTIDQRTLYQSYAFVSFIQFCRLFNNKKIDKIEKELRRLDETVAYELLDDVVNLINIKPSLYGELDLILESESHQDDRDVVIAHLKEHEYLATTASTSSKRRQMVIPQKVTIQIHQATNLARLGVLGYRNPTCIIKWNMREIGRTQPIRSTLSPQWVDCTFTTSTIRNQLLKDCSLDIEIFDTDSNNTAKDFLGCIHLQGKDLTNFLMQRKKQFFLLEKLKRFSDFDNKSVQGELEISGTAQENHSKKNDLISKIEQSIRSEKFATPELAKEKEIGVHVPAKINSEPIRMDTFSMSKSLSDEKLDTIRPSKSITFYEGPDGKPEQLGINTNNVVTLSDKIEGQSPKDRYDLEEDTELGEDTMSSDGMKDTIPLEHSIVSNTVVSTPPIKKLYLSLLTLQNLLITQKILCVIKLNGYDVGHIKFNESHPAVSFIQDEETNSQLHKHEHHHDLDRQPLKISTHFSTSGIIELDVPEEMPMNGCYIEIEFYQPKRDSHLWNALTGKSIPLDGPGHTAIHLNENQKEYDMIGMVEIRGRQLLLEIERGDQIITQPSVYTIKLNSLQVQQTTRVNSPPSCEFLISSQNFSDRPIPRYQLYILSAKNVANADLFGSSDPFVTVIYNGMEIGRTKFISNTLNPDWGNDECFDIIVPVGLSIQECQLEIEVYDHDYSSENDFLGSTWVHGDALLDLFHYGNDKPNPMNQSNYGQASMKEMNKVKPSEKVKPSWLSGFFGSIPGLSKKDKAQKISGLDGTEYPLKPSAKHTNDENKAVRGSIKLRGVDLRKDAELSAKESVEINGKIDTQVSNPQMSLAEMTSLKVPILQQELYSTENEGIYPLQLLPTESLEPMIATNPPDIKSIPTHSLIANHVMEVVQNCTPLELHLNVFSAKSLSKADTFGLSDPFVQIIWNGKIVGQTISVQRSLNPDWGDQEMFVLRVPRGHKLEGCTLELAVYDEDKLSMGDFLGCRVFRGPDLINLIKKSGGKVRNRSKNIENKAKRGNFYSLEKSNRHTFKENELVKGEVEVGLISCYHDELNQIEFVGRESLWPDKYFEFNSTDIQSVEFDILSIEGILRTDLVTNIVQLYPLEVHVVWNSEIIYHMEGKYNSYNHKIEFSVGSSSCHVGPLYIPQGFTLLDCHLSMLFWKSSSNMLHAEMDIQHSTCIGCITLSGQELTQFISLPTQPPSAVHEETSSIISKDSKNSLEKNQQAMELSHGLNSIEQPSITQSVTSNDHLPKTSTYSFHKALIVPDRLRTTKPSNGKVHLIGRFCLPDDDEKSIFDSITSHPRRTLPQISTDLKESTKRWRYFFDTNSSRPPLDSEGQAPSWMKTTENPSTLRTSHIVTDGMKRSSYYKPASQLDNDDEEEVEEEEEPDVQYFYTSKVGSKPMKRLSSPSKSSSDHIKSTNNSSKNPISRLVSNTSMDLTSMSTSSPLNNAVKYDNRISNAIDENHEFSTLHANNNHYLLTSHTSLPQSSSSSHHPTDLSQPKSTVSRSKVELPAMNFSAKVREINDENRVCWRGRVMPKKFIASGEVTRKAIMATRSSRLIKTKSITEMMVLADVHQLLDDLDEEHEINELPVCVMEVLSEGPGLVKRIFRVEISANNGVLLGAVDIFDDDYDIRRVVGSEYESSVLIGDRSSWNMPLLFEHIVRNRMILDMMPARNPVKLDEDVPLGRIHREFALQSVPTQSYLEFGRSVVSLTRDPEEDALATVGDTASILDRTDVLSEDYGTDVMTIQKETVGMERTDQDIPDMKPSKMKKYWIRIHSRSHRIVGKPLRSIVLLESFLKPFAIRPDQYFQSISDGNLLQDMDIVVRCKDCYTKETFELSIPGSDAMEWLPQQYELDLTTKFRRNKFGSMILQYVSIRFSIDAKPTLYLIRDTKKKVEQISLEDILQNEEVIDHEVQESNVENKDIED